ncbi:MAG TPA: response regulator [Chromatiales bacterium]|nr:response regulator [Chromatiales bacterium]
MARKRALVVDDSKTARMVMAKRLEEQQLDVDTVNSAGAAIDYLCDNIPNVIFMDYQMPGMDGFQALKAIKSNPATATIPVLMYTSQENAVQVSQARALGAVGVLPKAAQAKDLAEMLEELHLLPHQEPPETIAPTKEQEPEEAIVPISTEPAPETGDDTIPVYPNTIGNLENIAQQAEQSMKVGPVLRRLLGQYHKVIRHDLSRQYSQFTNAVEQQIEDLHRSLEQVTERINENRSAWSRWKGWLAFLLLLIPLFLLYREVDEIGRQRAAIDRKVSHINMRLDRLAADARRKGVRITTPSVRPSAVSNRPSPQTGVNAQAALDTLQWAINQNNAFPYDEQPFSEARIPWLSDLLSRLANMGFIGTVQLTSHLGRFCLQEGDHGLTLANDDRPASECRFRPLNEPEAVTEGAFQTIGFSNYLATAPALADGKITVEINSAGISRPITPYPSVSTAVTAGEWNRIAERNQRIEIKLIPRRP